MPRCISFFASSIISILSIIIIIFIAVSIYSVHPLLSQQPPPSTNSNSSWMTGASIPTARSEIAGAALDGKIYVVGGFDNNGRSSDSVEVYDVIADNWTTGESLPQPLDHTAAASFDGKLYVVGGGYLNRADLSDKLFIYDPSTKSWTEGANLPSARGALTANFVKGIFDEPNAS